MTPVAEDPEAEAWFAKVAALLAALRRLHVRADNVVYLHVKNRRP